MAKVLSVIAHQGFQDKEYEISKKALEDAGHEVVTASNSEHCEGKYGAKLDSDVLMEDVNTDDYDALIFIGGPGSHSYFNDMQAHQMAKAFHDAEKPLGAICAAPTILAKAGVLKDRKCTAYEDQHETLSSLSVAVQDEDVVTDAHLVTARDADSAKAFGEAVAALLK